METVRDCSSTANRCPTYGSDRVNKTLKDMLLELRPPMQLKIYRDFCYEPLV